LAVLVLLAVCVVARGSHAEERSEKALAAAHFERGLSFAKAGELESAIQEFETAYRTRPHFSVLYNLGQAYAALGRPIQAVDALERFLEQGGSQVPPPRRKEVEALLEKQRARIGHATLRVEPEGAELFVDGVSAGTGPFTDSVDLGQGLHVFAARKAGYTPRAVSVTVLPGETLELALVLVREPEPIPPVVSARPAVAVSTRTAPRETPPTTAPVRDTSSSARRTWAAGVGIGGFLLSGAAIITYAVNDSRYDAWYADRARVDAAIKEGGVTPALYLKERQLGQEAAEIQRMDDIALGLGLAGGAALVTAAILWFTSDGAEPGTRAATSK
jgi:hypothetical protein